MALSRRAFSKAVLACVSWAALPIRSFAQFLPLGNWRPPSGGGGGGGGGGGNPGGLWAWGGNAAGQMGDGTAASKSSPIQIGTLTNWSKIDCSVSTSVAIKTNGTLWAWGASASGQVGDGTAVNRSSPVQIGTLTTWESVSTGGGGASGCWTYAVKTDGTLWTWGANGFGQLAQNGVVNRSSPVQVGTFTNWSKVSAGGSHGLALKSDGTLWAWGYNLVGQLGNGLTANTSSPIQVGTLTNWAKIAAGGLHSAAIKTNGTLWTWGGSGSGPLGDSTAISKSSPVQLGTFTNWLDIVSGSTNSNIALKTDGTLWAWGLNLSGNLGIGTGITTSSPVQVGALTDWAKIAHSGSSATAIKSNGTLWAWGIASSGQIGNNQTAITAYSSPVQVGTLTGWQSCASYTNQVLAIR